MKKLNLLNAFNPRLKETGKYEPKNINPWLNMCIFINKNWNYKNAHVCKSEKRKYLTFSLSIEKHMLETTSFCSITPENNLAKNFTNRDELSNWQYNLVEKQINELKIDRFVFRSLKIENTNIL